MRTALAIAAAGALGALARYGIGGVVGRRTSGESPWATFVINITGSFVLGLVITLATERWTAAPWIRSALTIGVIGSYTTFSTVAFETHKLTVERAYGLAAANMIGSCAAGLAAIYVGVALARAL